MGAHRPVKAEAAGSKPVAGAIPTSKPLKNAPFCSSGAGKARKTVHQGSFGYVDYIEWGKKGVWGAILPMLRNAS